jgi:hypothetical protein
VKEEQVAGAFLNQKGIAFKAPEYLFPVLEKFDYFCIDS